MHILTFAFNEILPVKENTLTGGSAIYLQAKRALTIRCAFKQNKGDCSVKVDNDFDNVAIPVIKKLFSTPSVLFKDCTFEIDPSSYSSLSYIRGAKKATNVDVQECIFTGELAKGAHHIYANSLYKNAEFPKLRIKSCKFSSNQENSINDFSNSLVSFDARNQIFNYNGENDLRSQNTQTKAKYATLVQVVLIVSVVALVAIVSIVVKKSFYSGNEKSDNEDNTNEPLNQNLI